jgi:hypothetical protein
MADSSHKSSGDLLLAGRCISSSRKLFLAAAARGGNFAGVQ